MTKSVYVTDPDELLKLLTDDTLKVNDVSMVSDEMLRVRYEHHDMFAEDLKNVNCCIGKYSFVGYMMLLVFCQLDAYD